MFTSGSIPPEYSGAEVIGYLKGNAHLVARTWSVRHGKLSGTSLAMRLFVSTVGRDEEMIRAYIKIRRWQISSWIRCS